MPSSRSLPHGPQTVVTTLALGALVATTGLAAANPPPNVLYIAIDDLNPKVSSFAAPEMHTPNLDALSRRGVRFTRAYAQYPVCGPSRVSFLSGWYCHRTQYFSTGDRHIPRQGPLEHARYLPQAFRDAGYMTARLDKIFHIGSDDPASWDISEEPFRNPDGTPRVVWQSGELAALGLESRVLRHGAYSYFPGENGTFYELSNEVDPDDLTDGLTTTRAVELLGRFRQSPQPFFLAVGYRRPHLPCIAPQRFFDLYPRDRLPPQIVQPGVEPLPDEDYRSAVQAYLACVSMIDEQVGRLLAGLQANGLAENTIIVLHGDHGYNQGERQNHFGKGNLYERSLWTPLVVVEPNSPRAGAVSEQVVGLIDLYPTLLELCRLGPVPAHLDGRSLLPLLRSAESPWEDFAVAYENSSRQSTLRDSEYRLVVSADGDPQELFHLPTDPFEWHNRVNDPDQRDRVDRMSTRLAAILRQSLERPAPLPRQAPPSLPAATPAGVH